MKNTVMITLLGLMAFPAAGHAQKPEAAMVKAQIEDDNSTAAEHTPAIVSSLKSQSGNFRNSKKIMPSAALLPADLTGRISLLDHTGPEISYNYIVRNLGEERAVNFHVHVVLADSPSPASNHTVIADYVHTLAPGGSFERTDPGDVRHVQAGSYYLGIFVDPSDAVYEFNNDNNNYFDTRKKATVPTMADLVASVVVNDAVGPEISFTFDPANIGDADASAFQVYILLSKDRIITPEDSIIAEYGFTGMSGNYNAVNGEAYIGHIAAGTYYLGVYMDATQAVEERDETNNGSYDDSPAIVIDANGNHAAFDFNNLQGWYLDGVYANNRNDPYEHKFFLTSWGSVNFPNPPGKDPPADGQGALGMTIHTGANFNFAGANYWIMQLRSPDLTYSTAWQQASGYSVEIAQVLSSSSSYSATLFVKVFDLDQSMNRYFCTTAGTSLPFDVWNDDQAVWTHVAFDWSKVPDFPVNHIIRQIHINIIGWIGQSVLGTIALDSLRPWDIYAALFVDNISPIQGAHWADLDADGDVDIADVQIIAGRWGSFTGEPSYQTTFDLDHDGDIDIADVQKIAGQWGKF